MEGTARLNLRLLAKSIIGDLRSSRLSAERFLYHANIIASLTRPEIQLIAALLKARASITKDQYYSVSHASTAYEQAFKLLVPNVFRDGLELKVSAAALTRHGLVFSYGGLDGGTTYGLSPLIDEFMSLAEFEDALRKEDIKDSGE